MHGLFHGSEIRADHHQLFFYNSEKKNILFEKKGVISPLFYR